MRIRKRTLLLASTLLLLPRICPADDASTPRTITVNGEAEVRVVPDEVVLTVGVESFDPNLDMAKSDNDKRVTSLMGVTLSLGVPKERVRTDYLSISPVYEGQHAYEKLVGYVVRRTEVITLNDIGRFERLLSSAVAAGVNYVHGVDFRTSELRRHRDKARALALQAAREKADAMARQLGQTIAKPVSIQEGYGGWWSSYGSWWGASRGGAMYQNVAQNAPSPEGQAEGPTAPGQISVTAHVTVSFQLGN